MKKLLITSTALVATAGMAAADGHAGVALSGAAEMGIASVDTAASATDGDPELHSAFDVTFKLSGETDGGLSFGGSFDLDETDDGANPFGAGVGDQAVDGSVFLKGGFGNLTLGDTDGAVDWANQEVAMGTAIADDHTAHAGYFGGGGFDAGAVLRYDNTFGDFGVAISVQDIAADDVVAAVGLKYAADLGGTSVAVGLGYQDAGAAGDIAALSLGAGIAGFDVVLNYSDWTIAGVSASHVGLGLGYTVDALSFHANYGEYDIGGVTVDGFGLNVNYDLGGGAVVALGYGSDDAADRYSLGIRMDF